MMSDEELAARILYKLIRRGKWKASHTPIELLKWGIPPELRGRAKDTIKILIKKNWLIIKKTSHGDDIYLNIEHSEGIKNFVKKNLPTYTW